MKCSATLPGSWLSGPRNINGPPPGRFWGGPECPRPFMRRRQESSGALARQWSQTSSGEYLGLYPAYTLGTLADRNHVVARDFSALGPAPRRRDGRPRPAFRAPAR